MKHDANFDEMIRRFFEKNRYTKEQRERVEIDDEYKKAVDRKSLVDAEERAIRILEGNTDDSKNRKRLRDILDI